MMKNQWDHVDHVGVSLESDSILAHETEVIPATAGATSHMIT